MVALLHDALVREGHRSIVLGDLRGPGRRPRSVERSLDADLDAEDTHRAAIARVLDGTRVDVVHMHGVDFVDLLPAEGTVLATLHGSPSAYPPEAFTLGRPDTHLHCISASQRRACPPGARLLDDIPYGIAVERYGPAAQRDDFAVSIGRMCPEKGFHLALDAARLAGMPLLLAGVVQRRAVHRAYFLHHIAPRLDPTRRFLGAIDFDKKCSVLSRARCLLVPSLAPETSSIVAMEALASGTPVIAFPAGALAEIVEPGRTGFLVESVEEMADAMRRVDEIDRDACRQAAVERFSAGRTARRYLDRYQAIAPSRVPPPTARDGLTVDTLDSTTALEGVVDEWAALWDRCPRATAFQHPAWLMPLGRRFPDEGPWCLSLRRGGRLVGLLPLARGPDRSLVMLGAGLTDRLDALLEDSERATGVSAWLSHLAEHRLTFLRCDLDELPPDSPLLEGAAPAELHETLDLASPCPTLRLPGHPDAEPALPPRLLSSVDQARRRALRGGTLDIERADEANLGELLDALFRLHVLQWEAHGDPGGLADPAARAFHRDAAQELLRAGLLATWALRLDGQIVGVLHGLCGHRRTMFCAGAFDAAHERLHVGAQLVRHAIEHAARAGHVEFDFLRGQHSYKYAWGAVDRVQWRRTFRRRPEA
jgi:glycosyltransferase involved in cell wall biosynthesis/CelD/BcsL family acetyltransferase involved in cellulose biosynthesis